MTTLCFSYGRMTSITLFTCIQILAIFVTAFAPNVWVYVVGRTVTAVAIRAAGMSALVMGKSPLWRHDPIMTSWYGNALRIIGPFMRGIHLAKGQSVIVMIKSVDLDPHYDVMVPLTTCLLCGEFTVRLWIPRTKASHAELDVFFDLRLNKRLSKQPWGRWFEKISRRLWRHCTVYMEVDIGVRHGV